MLLTVPSTSSYRKEEPKAFCWKKKKVIKKKKGEKKLGNLELIRGRRRQHHQHPYSQMAENTNTCSQHGPRTSLLPSGGRLASWRNGFVASSDLIPKKGGHRAGGLLAAARSRSPIFPGSVASPSTAISSHAQSSSRRSTESPQAPASIRRVFLLPKKH